MAIISVLLSFGAAVFFHIGLRAPSMRTILLTSHAWIKGIPVVWVDQPALAAKVLKASTYKDEFFERLYGEPAWVTSGVLEYVDEP
ncbi:hypothetical protein THRCLA_20886 [Thraustotheca clavata]|uniref:Uncharacterized protein n=1 Tax=Thraustotheca clavata TaxID=74557 RepID=A0A1W0A2C9_9STRA|nr:hypothetical protein THRCLA_20886 [Thraustotheca clavata]